MEKFITDERTGLQYELVGDYYLIAGEDEPEGRPIGIWGPRHLRYIRSAAKMLTRADILFFSWLLLQPAGEGVGGRGTRRAHSYKSV